MLAREGRFASIDRAIDETKFVVGPKEMLDVALGRMQAAGCSMAPVMVDGRMEGLLTLENAVEYLSFRQALGVRRDQNDGSEELGSDTLDARPGALRG